MTMTIEKAKARIAELKAIEGDYTAEQLSEIKQLDDFFAKKRKADAANDAAKSALGAIGLDQAVDDEDDLPLTGRKDASHMFGPGAKSLGLGDARIAQLGELAAKKAFKFSDTVGFKDGLSLNGSVSVPLLDPANNSMVIAGEARPPQTMLEILPVAQAMSGVVEYLRQGPRNTKAEVVPAGELKPTTDVGLSRVSVDLKVVAHISKADQYLLKDISSAMQFWGNELLWGLRDTVENKIINGAGGGTDVSGILTTTGVRNQEFDTDVLTTVRRGLLQLETAGYVPSFIVVSPSVWADLELQRNTSGQFDLHPAAGPIDSVARKLWGTQLVTSRHLADDTAMVVSEGAAGVFVDESAVTAWAREASDAFERNQIVARSEMRVETALLRPDGVLVASLTDTP